MLVLEAATGVTDTDDDAAPVPAELVAVTEQLYVTPLVSPVTVIGLEEPVATSEPEDVQVAV